MSWILLRKRMDNSLSAMKRGLWWRMHVASFIQAWVATCGGTINNSSCKLIRQLRSSKRHILTASCSLCSISCLHTHHLGMMPFVPLIWIDWMGAHRKSKEILSFWWIICVPSFVARHKKWPPRLVQQKASNRCWWNVALTLDTCMQNAVPFALLRILTVAWHDFWASKIQLQESLLKKKIKGRWYISAFLPKFHCELNPIKMVFYLFSFLIIFT